MKKKVYSKIRYIIVVSMAMLIACMTTSCAWFDNEMKNIKGELIGNKFNIDFYDNYGDNILTIHGKKVGIEANYVKTKSVNSDGESSTNYELSSVVTITVDGNQVNQTGNTVIFAEEGLEKVEDFELPDDVTGSGGTINAIDRNINKIKNILGTSKVVVICSQLGVPLAVYGGEDVYWEIPDDLPKTTKLNIDGKALYIHRANYIMLDNDLID